MKKIIIFILMLVITLYSATSLELKDYYNYSYDSQTGNCGGGCPTSSGTPHPEIFDGIDNNVCPNYFCDCGWNGATCLYDDNEIIIQFNETLLFPENVFNFSVANCNNHFDNYDLYKGSPSNWILVTSETGVGSDCSNDYQSLRTPLFSSQYIKIDWDTTGGSPFINEILSNSEVALSNNTLPVFNETKINLSFCLDEDSKAGIKLNVSAYDLENDTIYYSVTDKSIITDYYSEDFQKGNVGYIYFGDIKILKASDITPDNSFFDNESTNTNCYRYGFLNLWIITDLKITSNPYIDGYALYNYNCNEELTINLPIKSDLVVFNYEFGGNNISFTTKFFDSINNSFGEMEIIKIENNVSIDGNISNSTYNYFMLRTILDFDNDVYRYNLLERDDDNINSIYWSDNYTLSNYDVAKFYINSSVGTYIDNINLYSEVKYYDYTTNNFFLLNYTNEGDYKINVKISDDFHPNTYNEENYYFTILNEQYCISTEFEDKSSITFEEFMENKSTGNKFFDTILIIFKIPIYIMRETGVADKFLYMSTLLSILIPFIIGYKDLSKNKDNPNYKLNLPKIFLFSWIFTLVFYIMEIYPFTIFVIYTTIASIIIGVSVKEQVFPNG